MTAEATTTPTPAPEASAGRIHQLVDRLIAVYSEGPLRDEVAAAREEYFTRAGKVFEDDAELFDQRIAAFLEWYVLDRPLQGGDPPVHQALRSARFADDDRETLAFLAAGHRSLFDIAAVEGGRIQVEDVLGGARFSVVERRSTVGFAPGELLEARLVWDGREVVFGKTFLFHPSDAREEILNVVDGLAAKGTAGEEIIFTLSRLHIRWHRLGHTGAARIYREGLTR